MHLGTDLQFIHNDSIKTVFISFNHIQQDLTRYILMSIDAKATDI